MSKNNDCISNANERIEVESGEDGMDLAEMDEVENGFQGEKKGCEHEMEDGKVDEVEWCTLEHLWPKYPEY